jgi:hypothetical protein
MYFFKKKKKKKKEEEEKIVMKETPQKAAQLIRGISWVESLSRL